jgi:hypothetical protein
VYVENPKESMKHLSELINEFSKVSGFKIHIQNSITFLCICNENLIFNLIKMLSIISPKNEMLVGHGSVH